MKNIVLAFDSFKGTLSAQQACKIVERAAKRRLPMAQITDLPFADGGEGLVEAMLCAVEGERVEVDAHDARGRAVKAAYALLNDGTAVVEMAAASGLPLVADLPLDAIHASSFGTGELIAHALAQGCKKLILGLGGSATSDGGAGMALALGIRYVSENGTNIACGADLIKLSHIDITDINPALRECSVVIACDVNNPLYGSMGAAHIYSPQKGATEEEIILLDSGLERLAGYIYKNSETNMQLIKGTGAAGGLAVPLLAYANAEIRSGADTMLDACGFDAILKGCDLVITGEGSTDKQSCMGKAIGEIARYAKKAGVPVVVLSGVLGDGHRELYDTGVTAMFSTLTALYDRETVLENAAENLENAADNLFRLLSILC